MQIFQDIRDAVESSLHDGHDGLNDSMSLSGPRPEATDVDVEIDQQAVIEASIRDAAFPISFTAHVTADVVHRDDEGEVVLSSRHRAPINGEVESFTEFTFEIGQFVELKS